MKVDLDKYLERLVKNLPLLDDEGLLSAYGYYADTVTAICAVLREKRESGATDAKETARLRALNEAMRLAGA